MKTKKQLILVLAVLTLSLCFGQSVTGTCSHVWIDQAHFFTSGDNCTLVISPAPSPGAVVIYTVAGYLDSNGNVIPAQIPLDFHGYTSLSYSGPTIGSITYNGTTIYTRPLP